MNPRTKRILINLLKFGVSGAIIGYLIYDARQDNTFARLRDGQKQWGQLLLAGGCISSSIMLTFVRWHFLARALQLKFGVRDALRLGFIGYLFNFVSLGSVGGDLFKAIFVAREQPGRRTAAVATVVIDRLVGLYAVVLVAAVATLATGLQSSRVPEVRIICQGTLVAAVVGGLGLAVLVIPGFTTGALSEMVAGIPRIGRTLFGLVQAIRMYRKRPDILLLTGLMSIGIHCLTTLGIYLIARGLPGNAPPLGQQFIAVPLAIVAGALPLPLNGLGAFEGVIEFLYVNLPGSDVARGQGLLVALAYRVITVLLAMVSAGVYLSSRREMDVVIHEAEELQEAEAAA
ncbi:MAG: flippase-like domain-containing protein [Planctomycetes bacterium]|nr:flippase-like domain-containing protein [Planctomycetota bacterium]